MIVEDSEDDALLPVKQLRLGGFVPEYTRVETAETMRQCLKQGTWDIVFSDFTIIAKLPVNEIKIDRSFVNGMLANDNDATIVRSVVELGHNLGLKVVAEGVETKEMLDWLSTFGCDQAQGFFISQPRPCEQLRNWLATSSWQPARI